METEHGKPTQTIDLKDFWKEVRRVEPPIPKDCQGRKILGIPEGFGAELGLSFVIISRTSRKSSSIKTPPIKEHPPVLAGG
ncbi:hypothetical protein N7456_001293 [Penicillium angulare]|uniref:Uncharacterized protein n=1 Tax=Penicillium angulare TaxID=116970 RepID=A0A9W9KSX9_9EURO|nr:hypothetical protein N7456_001293 [Penicillium angulare]